MLSCSYPGAFGSFSARLRAPSQRHRHSPGLLDGGAGRARLGVLSLCPRSPLSAVIYAVSCESQLHLLREHNVIFRIPWFRP